MRWGDHSRCSDRQNPDLLGLQWTSGYVGHLFTPFAEALRVKVALLATHMASGISGSALLPLVGFSSTACALGVRWGCRFLEVLRLCSVRQFSLVAWFVVDCCKRCVPQLLQDLLLLVYGLPLPHLHFAFLQCEFGIHGVSQISLVAYSYHDSVPNHLFFKIAVCVILSQTIQAHDELFG